nr:carcinoembryonic antigen-related cell adhesion molecule 21-like isoform X2 [Pogona vitticeps]
MGSPGALRCWLSQWAPAMAQGFLLPGMSRTLSRPHSTAGACSGCRRGHLLNSYFFTLTECDQNFSILVIADPWFPLVGTEVSLIPNDSMENVLICAWYRWDISVENQILVYEPPPVSKVEHKDSYTGRESMTADCALHIANVSLPDGGYYIIQKNTTVASEAGQIFLMVVEGFLQPKSPKVLSEGAIAGIFVLGVVIITVIASLVSYKILSSSAG